MLLAILPLLAGLALARASVSSESAVLPARPRAEHQSPSDDASNSERFRSAPRTCRYLPEQPGRAVKKRVRAAPGEAITVAFCWTHLRRRFLDIAKSGNAPIARKRLKTHAALYSIEKTIREKERR